MMVMGMMMVRMVMMMTHGHGVRGDGGRGG
jgi:hypothetical protein